MNHHSSCSVAVRNTLQLVLKTAQHIISILPLAVADFQHTQCLRQAHSITRVPSHPNHKVFKTLTGVFLFLINQNKY